MHYDQGGTAVLPGSRGVRAAYPATSRHLGHVAVTSLELSTDDVAKLARTVPALPEPERPRIIVAPSAHVFGLARMFQALGEGTRPRLQVVRTLEEACALLSVSQPRFEPLEPSDSDPVPDPGKD